MCFTHLSKLRGSWNVRGRSLPAVSSIAFSQLYPSERTTESEPLPLCQDHIPPSCPFRTRCGWQVPSWHHTVCPSEQQFSAKKTDFLSDQSIVSLSAWERLSTKWWSTATQKSCLLHNRFLFKVIPRDLSFITFSQCQPNDQNLTLCGD